MRSHEDSPLLGEKFVYIGEFQSDEKARLHERGLGWGKLSWPYWIVFLVLLSGFCILPRLERSEPQQEVFQDALGTSNYTCVPGHPCWPSPSDWSTFNRSINGSLKLTVPWAAPCYSGSSSKECQEVAQQYMHGVSRTAQYGAMEFLDWETCGQSQCFLNSNEASSPGNCSLGRLSTYHVEARTADDISQTLDFVREHRIRLSIKNTGHDYFGRSNAANSLAIWTHNMKRAKYHKTFQPQGCKTQYENIGEIGAGVQAYEAVKFFEPLSMQVTVGAVGSVGIAGGYGQGGGHGPLGPSYGLMVDQAVEFEVVTADGQKRTINECTDPDLFWAMRGGGGSTYAVLTSYKFQLHPMVPMQVYSVKVGFPAPKGKLNVTESKVHRDIIRALASNQLQFSKHGIAGFNFLLADHMVSLQVMPDRDDKAMKIITSEWHDFLTNYPGLELTENAYYTFPAFSQWANFTQQPWIAQNGPVGLGIMEAGRFLPKDLFTSPENVERVVDAAVSAMQFSQSRLGACSIHFYATGPHNQPDNSKTGVNPAWRTALWEVIIGGAWKAETPLPVRWKIQETVSMSIDPFKNLTPGGGCYMNEGDWTEQDWQQTFFGDNYAPLLAVKKRYDPTGLFNCWKCVGWTGYRE